MKSIVFVANFITDVRKLKKTFHYNPNPLSSNQLNVLIQFLKSTFKSDEKLWRRRNSRNGSSAAEGQKTDVGGKN